MLPLVPNNSKDLLISIIKGSIISRIATIITIDDPKNWEVIKSGIIENKNLEQVTDHKGVYADIRIITKEDNHERGYAK